MEQLLLPAPRRQFDAGAGDRNGERPIRLRQVGEILRGDVLVVELAKHRRSGDLVELVEQLAPAPGAFRGIAAFVERAWSGRELFDKLDEITGTTVFREKIRRAHV